jgi:hypothetical protein
MDPGYPTASLKRQNAEISSTLFKHYGYIYKKLGHGGFFWVVPLR